MEKDTIGGGGGGRFKLLNLHKDVDTPDENLVVSASLDTYRLSSSVRQGNPPFIWAGDVRHESIACHV